MRVIAGEAKGHRLKTPAIGTRPMTDRMKESLFSALGDLTGTRALDLYAGSGALGLEALSRGATMAVFVESAREAIVKLEQNITGTRMKHRSEVLWADVRQVLRKPPDDRFDLIFVDPPYQFSATDVQEDLEALVMQGYLGDDGRIVVHRPTKDMRLDPLGLEMVWQRAFGQSHLCVFVHEEEV